MYYRSCWHIVCRDFLIRYRQPNVISYIRCSSLITALYNPKAFIVHAVLLHQTFVHCGRFPTAASRRSLGRISIPVWRFSLSAPLNIIALVGHYPTNKLILRTPILNRWIAPPFNITSCEITSYPVLATVSRSYPSFKGRLSTCYSPIRH